MLASSLSEVTSLGALFPFLGALSNVETLLYDRKLQPLLASLKISSSDQLVTTLAFLFVTVVVITSILRIATVQAQIRLASAIGSDLSCKIYDLSLQQPYSFHVQQNSSELISTLTEDTAQMTIGILTPLLGLATNIFVTLTLVGGLLLIDWRIATTTAVALGVSYTFIYLTRRKLLQRNSKIITAQSQRKIKAVQEGLGGIRDVLLTKTDSFFREGYDSSERALRQAKATNAIIARTPRYVVEATAMSVIALLALTIGKNGDFSRAIPILGSLALGANRLLPAVQQSFAALVTIQGSHSSLRRVLVASNRLASPFQKFSSNVSVKLTNSLTLDRVWFRYGTESDWAVKDLSITISAKSTVGFIGTTGSGKSTIADLILGLLEPQKGSILVDGLPLTGDCLFGWQKEIAHVPQNIYLVDTTIAENIAFGVPRAEIDFDRVVKAAKLAQIDDFIQDLPNNYKTFTGERGVQLSGGQRQRIGIARALYRQASVIVFDEATSALDSATERELMTAINSLSRYFTIILIAHRLSTLEKCDCVFEINKGTVIRSGSVQDLIKRSSLLLQ